MEEGGRGEEGALVPPRHVGPAWAYRLLGMGALPLALPLFAFHPRLRGGLRERLGDLPLGAERFAGGVWYHGASAGDCVALLPLARRSVAYYPVVISTFTRSGAEMLHARLRAMDDAILPLRAPFDVSFSVVRFFRRLRPRLLVLECLEVWPLWVAEAMRRGVPVAIVNGRLSPRSLRRYRRASGIFSPLFAGIAWVSAIDEAHAARFIAAGVPSSRVSVFSSTKHAAQIVVPSVPLHRARNVVLGSVHRTELRLLLPSLLERLPRESVIVVAPRYLHGISWIRRIASRHGWSSRRSSRSSSRASPGEILILDEMGGLGAAYAEASVAFVGGSLEARGGHNVIEAAAQAVPVITGPHVDACSREMETIVAAGGGWIVADAESAVQRIVEASRYDRRAAAGALAVATRLGESADEVHARLLRLVT